MVVKTHIACAEHEAVPIGECECLTCDNVFYVPAGWEMVPNCCPWCGTRFVGFADANNEIRNKVGLVQEPSDVASGS